MNTTFLNWLNDEPQTIVLQRDNTFALLSWRDFNQPQENAFTFHTAAWLFLLGAAVPLIMLT